MIENLGPGSALHPKSASKIDILLESSLHDAELVSSFHAPRFRQRLAIIQAWGVREGETILDIGCGQGESCLALALEVGPRGHITGIDPAQLDYGHPFTMREAHHHIQKSVLGPRISFFPVDTPSYLAKLDGQRKHFDSVTLCHSLWYFPNDQAVYSLFETLAKARIRRLYLAEWSYEPTCPSQVAHILAAKAQALLYRYKTPSEPGLREQNVRVGVDQQLILKAAHAAGFKVTEERFISSAGDMREGQFEVRFVLGRVFQQRVADACLTENQREEINAAILKLQSEMERLGSTNTATVGSMDVWCPVLELNK
ncbi:hypothetical protein UVI_02052320 [Ustilaginoidea virens]|nr:hypothetical protein UVI_02052320 [Ustilaginoidea virens]FAA01155.1 TPA: SAM-dependent methyltransferase [Ustilaginoidea virens]